MQVLIVTGLSGAGKSNAMSYPFLIKGMQIIVFSKIIKIYIVKL